MTPSPNQQPMQPQPGQEKNPSPGQQGDSQPGKKPNQKDDDNNTNSPQPQSDRPKS